MHTWASRRPHSVSFSAKKGRIFGEGIMHLSAVSNTYMQQVGAYACLLFYICRSWLFDASAAELTLFCFFYYFLSVIGELMGALLSLNMKTLWLNINRKEDHVYLVVSYYIGEVMGALVSYFCCHFLCVIGELMGTLFSLKMRTLWLN